MTRKCISTKKLWIIGVAVLVLVVGATVGVTLSIGRNDSPPTTVNEKLLQLRALMKEHNIDAYIIPAVDAHQSEYISNRDRRIEYISAFTGSNGRAVVTADQAALWTDSRYHIQAADQLDSTLWTLMRDGTPDVPTYDQWLPGQIRVGIDPFLIDAAGFGTMATALTASGSVLVEVLPNLVDEIWTDKPVQSYPEIQPLAIEFSGKRAAEKVSELREVVVQNKGTAIVVSALDDVAWLLNLRGSDISNNPVFFAYVLVTLDSIQLYIAPSRITATIQAHFVTEGLVVVERDYDTLTTGIQSVLAAASDAKLLLSTPSQAIYSTVPVDRQVTISSPVNLMKVIKNAVEAEGMRRAHVRDGAAVIKYLHWLDENIDSSVVTELSGAAQLGLFRSEGEHFKGLSFTAISAVGAHAAMAHYSPTSDTDARITRDQLYLIDSGGQYLDGTTDITRTVHYGTPTADQKDSFTRVLKGFISLSRAIFPKAAPPSFLDAMARRSLWDVGLNYGHGTGHGVGSYLNVHEYPPLISSTNTPPGMQENMFTSNEPGYYEEGEYGIRIEDVIQVVAADASKLRGNFGGVGALTFLDITVAPIQTTLINEELLTYDEAVWLNDYHRGVRTAVRSFLNDAQFAWLERETPDVRYYAVINETCSAVCR